MARDISLTSQEWCDLIFEGKNQEYGAYKLRKTSSKRHVTALVIVIAVLFTGLLLQHFIRANATTDTTKIAYVDPVTLGKFDNKPEEIKPVIPEPELPPAPDIRKSLAFNPPKIVEEQSEDAKVYTQDELSEKKDYAISVATVESGSTTGVDIKDILGEVGGTGGGGGTTEIFEHVEQMPAFPGGQSELMKFLNEKIKYPVISQEQGIQGTVVLRFVVGLDGTVTDIEVLRSLDPSCDKEAKRVLGIMPKWIPGKQNGRAVKVYFTVPVRFKLAS